MTLDEALAACPVVAIIRGVTPDEALSIADALFQAGLRGVEVPMNSPDPIRSIHKIAEVFGDRMVVGGGTVLTPARVDEVIEAGGRIIVSPNTNPAVIARTIAHGAESLPGFATPTDAFAAIDAGAMHLKLFPAATYGPGHVRQIRAVLPVDVTVWAVGGVGAGDFQDWWEAGVRAFGLGSELYKPGMSAEAVFDRAKTVVATAHQITARTAKV
jgi:2-dehydro-3-deoxyphosphogalactonate aldolase